MTLFFEIAMVIIAAFTSIIYTSDTLYWIYKEEKEQQEEEAKQAEEEKIKNHITKTLYS